jgi:Protein of unknown function (DUF1360)
MTDSATHHHGANGSEHAGSLPSRGGPLASHYAPGQERPLGSYAILAGVYGTALSGALVALRARRDELPQRVTAGDVLLVGVATHKLSRLIAKDKVTSFARAPFTRFQEQSGRGEVEEEPCGHGLRLAVGELLVCPYCLAQWIATAFTLGLVGAPRLTRVIGSIFVAHTLSDFLQVAYRAAEEQL